MRKINLFLSVVSVLILSGFQNLYAEASPNADYSVLVLGDLHFDGMEYHATPATTSNRAKERKRNCGMWEKATPELLTLAAKHADKNVPFVVQVGDFTQGDCDTFELHEKMIADGFAKVKSFFPEHKLLPVRGNHDVRMLKNNSGTPTVKAYFPRIAKELGVEKITGTYSVRHGKDLYIFFDGFVSKKQLLVELKKAFAENSDARHTFFITHLPVLNCATGNPAWLVPSFKAVRDLLLERNAIIITAHTHVPSLLQVERNGKKLTQVVVSTVGSNWKPEAKMEVHLSGYDNYLKQIGEKKLSSAKLKPSFDDMKTYTVPLFEIYRNGTGFCMLKIAGDNVTIEFYTNASGKPSMVKVLR